MFSLNINHIHMILQKHVFYTTNYKQQKQKHKKMQLIKYAIFQNVQINDLHACLVQRPCTDSHWVTRCYSWISKWSHQYILVCPQSLCTLYHSCIDVHVSCMHYYVYLWFHGHICHRDIPVLKIKTSHGL